MQYADSNPLLFLHPFHCSVFRAHALNQVGGYYSGGPPVPIPNTAVKPDCADDTCLETDWKNRSLPTSGPGVAKLRVLSLSVKTWYNVCWEDRELEFLTGLFNAMYEELPTPKPEKRK